MCSVSMCSFYDDVGCTDVSQLSGGVQVATTADEENVKKLSETNALPRLIACLYVKHRCGLPVL